MATSWESPEEGWRGGVTGRQGGGEGELSVVGGGGGSGGDDDGATEGGVSAEWIWTRVGSRRSTNNPGRQIMSC